MLLSYTIIVIIFNYSHISDVHLYKAGKNKMVLFDQVVTPSNFVAVGDSVASFNPSMSIFIPFVSRFY